MKIVSVTRILNEDDIVEAFVRHHATHVDHMLFLDNGSTDRTLEILRALKDEGFPMTVFQSHSATFDQQGTNSWAYQAASQLLGAEWVVSLDADEFIAAENSVPLASLLPENQAAVTARLVHYGQTREDDENEPVVPWRIRWRYPVDLPVEKIMLRGGMPGVTVLPGNHGALQGGRPIPAMRLEKVTLAHYQRRNGWQIVQKIAAGRLKALAGGQHGATHSRHYLFPFETLRDKPEEILGNTAYFTHEFERAGTVEAPLAYLGGELSYWQKSDPAMKAASAFLHFAERLAAQHGRILDEIPQARALEDAMNAKRDFLF